MSKQKPKLNQNTIHRVLKLIRPYTGMVILTLTFALITVVTTLLAPVLSGKAVDMILGPGYETDTKIYKSFTDTVQRMKKEVVHPQPGERLIFVPS